MMRILAIDTSTRTASVALLGDEEILKEVFVNLDINHSVVLLPVIDDLCRSAGIQPQEIDLFACTTGPGSFTGLRIGVSTVKGLALAAGKPVVGVSTLDALAVNLSESGKMICAMLDARKKQVYAALYRPVRSDFPERIMAEKAVDVLSLLADIPVEDTVIFVGDGAIAYKALIDEGMGGRAFFTTSSHNYIRAGAVGMLGIRKFRRGDVLDLISFSPQYMRSSEAELKIK